MATVRYHFVSSGQDSVLTAFKSVTAAAKESARVTVQGAKASHAATTSAAKAGASTDARRYKDAERVAAKITKEFEKEAKAAERAAQQKTKANESAAKQAIAAAERVSKQTIKAHEKTIHAQERLDERAHQKVLRHHEKQVEAARRAGKQRETAEKRASDKLATTRSARLERVGGLAKDAFLGGAVALGALGTGLIGAAARDSIRLGDASSRIAIAGRGAGQTAVDARTLSREFEATAMATPGIKAADVAEAVGAFVGKTGNLDVARQSQGDFATVASASGASIQDVATAAADLMEKFDVKTVDEMRTAMAALTFQGKKGSFELKDAAAQFGKLSAAASRFGLDKGARGVATLGGLTQIARSSTGSSEQAASAVEASLRQLVSKEGDIKKNFGVDVFADAGKTKTRDVRDVLGETIAGAKGNLPDLQKIFGEEGIRGISPLISTFNEGKNSSGAKDEAGQVADGLKKLREQLDGAIDAPGDWSEVQKDAALAQKATSAQVTAAWENMVGIVSERLTPVLLEIATKIGDTLKNTDAADDLVTVFVALAEAAKIVVDFFGMFKTKEKTKEQELKDKQKQLDDFDKSQPIGPQTAEQIAARAALVGDVDAAHGAAYATTKTLTKEEFAAQYAGLDPTIDYREEGGIPGQGARDRADNLAGLLTSNPNSFHDSMANIGTETTQQRDLRQSYQDQVTHQQMNGEFSGATPEADAAMKALVASAQQAAKALNSINSAGAQASVLGGPVNGPGP